MSKIRPEFEYLNRLRESGTTNMFGAGPYLRMEFDIGEREANQVLSEWMDWADKDPANLDL